MTYSPSVLVCLDKIAKNLERIANAMEEMNNNNKPSDPHLGPN